MIRPLRAMPQLSGRSGKRPDLNDEYYRSLGEANIARILRYLDIEYEIHRGINIKDVAEKHNLRKRETGRLLQEVRPDFYLPEYDTYIEVKPSGMDQNDRQRLAAVLLHRDEPRIEVIMPQTYRILEKAFREKIPEWET